MKQLFQWALPFLLTLLAAAPSFAQQAVTGKVVDGDNEPVIGATVVLQSMDSTFVDAAVTDETGSFTLCDEAVPFILTVQHVVYETWQRSYDKLDVGELVLEAKSNLLEEVSITAEQPFVKAEEGKLVYDTQVLTQHRIASNA